MLEYEEIKVYREQSGGKNLILVENNSNTIKFYDVSMEDVAVFIKKLLAEED